MPREILTVSVGQAGNQIAWRFWDMLVREHAAMGTPGVYDDGMSTFFENVRDDGDASSSGLSMGKPFAHSAARRGARPPAPSAASGYDYASLFASAPLKALRARAVLVDMEEGVVNQVLRSPIGDLFDRTSQLITDVSGAGNNWAAGFHGYGPVYGGTVMEKVRRALEACDSPQSFLLLHSTGGGTGSGLGSRILATLADEFPEMYRFASSVFPSEDDDVVTSPYNFALSFNQLAAHADCVLPLENQALLDVSAAVESGLRKLARGPGGGGSSLASASAVASARQSSLTFIPPPPMRASRLLYDSRPVAPLWSASSSRSVAGSLAGSRAGAAVARSSDGDSSSMRPRPRSSAAGAGAASVEGSAQRQPRQLTVLSSASEGALPDASTRPAFARPLTGAGVAAGIGEPFSSAAATPLKGVAASGMGKTSSSGGSPAPAEGRSSPAVSRHGLAAATSAAAGARNGAGTARGRGSHAAGGDVGADDRAGVARGRGSHAAAGDVGADDSVVSASNSAVATPCRTGRAASAGAVPRSRNLGHVAVGILPGMATKLPAQRRATRSRPPTTTASAAGVAGARGAGARVFYDEDFHDGDYHRGGAAVVAHGGSAEESYREAHDGDDDASALAAVDGESSAPSEAAPVLSSLAAADAAIARALAIAAANSESKEGKDSSSKPESLGDRKGDVAGATGRGPSGSTVSGSRTAAGTAAAPRPGAAGAAAAGKTAAAGGTRSSAALPPRPGAAGPTARGVTASASASSSASAKPVAASSAGKLEASSAAGASAAAARGPAERAPAAAASASRRGAAAAAGAGAGAAPAADTRRTGAPEARAGGREPTAAASTNPFIRLLQKRAANYGDADADDDHGRDGYRSASLLHRDSSVRGGRDASEEKYDGRSGAAGESSLPAGAAGYYMAAAADCDDYRRDDGDEEFDDNGDDEGSSGGAGGGLKRGRKGTAFDSMNNLAAHLVRCVALAVAWSASSLLTSSAVAARVHHSCSRLPPLQQLRFACSTRGRSLHLVPVILAAHLLASMSPLSSLQLTNLTASMRFEGPLNVDLNEITSTLVPFPRMHLLQSR